MANLDITVPIHFELTPRSKAILKPLIAEIIREVLQELSEQEQAVMSPTEQAASTGKD